MSNSVLLVLDILNYTLKMDSKSPMKAHITRSGRKSTPKILFDPSDLSDSDQSVSPVKVCKTDYNKKNVSPKSKNKVSPSKLKFDSPNCDKIINAKKSITKKTVENQANKNKENVRHTPRRLNYNNDSNTPLNKKEESPTEKDLPAKTPYTLRQRLKTKIQTEVEKEDEVPFDISESEWEESESESSDSQEEEEELAAAMTPILKHSKPIITLKQSSHYVFSSYDYLDKSSGKSLTSSHRLKKLDDIDQVTKLLSSYVPAHSSQINLLNKHNQSLFYKWMYVLSKGYNIIVYGLGSKKKLLDQFSASYLNSCKFITINGFFPGLTMKEILSSICELLGNKIKDNLDSVVSALEQLKYHIFLIIHNIDGIAIRQDKIQMFLSQISAYDKVHLITSIDHINAPLLWDQKKLSNFNFIWEECTTFLPYSAEKNFESSLLIKTSASMALSSLRNVFRSLNKNSRSIFKLLLEHSLTNKGAGMQFSELYRLCRRNFIVSSDLALRTQLTEFIDHQLVRWRKETDMLTISVEPDVLKSFKLEVDAQE